MYSKGDHTDELLDTVLDIWYCNKQDQPIILNQTNGSTNDTRNNQASRSKVATTSHGTQTYHGQDVLKDQIRHIATHLQRHTVSTITGLLTDTRVTLDGNTYIFRSQGDEYN